MSNLLEHAFNLSPMESDRTWLFPNEGTAGLPWITLVQKPEGAVLSVHYLRLRDATLPRLAYIPEFCSAPDSGNGESNGWTTLSGTETVNPLGGGWERVTVEDLAAVTTHAARFARVRVTIVP
ncbi:MAG: hypothetical protein EOP86_26865 [Verrucomicrobiaceae bacterium]|nr:MAG: hypothetical protein EOP86_26865 [Verrucomicrobiaceae bacterium]